jgi:hypothetical protein
MVHKQSLCSSFVEITRSFLEQRVDGEFEIKFLGLKLSSIFGQCRFLAMYFAFLSCITAAFFAIGVPISTAYRYKSEY